MLWLLFVIIIPALSGALTSGTNLAWVVGGEFVISWFNIVVILLSNILYHTIRD